MSVLWSLLIILLPKHLENTPIILLRSKREVPRALLRLLLALLGAAELFLLYHFKQMVQDEIFWGTITLLGLLSISIRFRDLGKVDEALTTSFLYSTGVAYLSFLLTTGQWHSEAILPALGFGSLVLSYSLAQLLTQWSEEFPSMERQEHVKKQRRKAEYMLRDLSVQKYSRMYSVSLPLAPLCFCIAAILHHLPSHYLVLILSLLVVREQVYTVRTLEAASPLPSTFLLRHERYVVIFLVLLVICGLLS